MADEKLDLLDLDDEIDLPELPDADGLSASRPRRPWLLFGAALIVIILATYIIVRIAVHKGNNDSVEIDLTMPVTTEQAAPEAEKDFAASADKVIEGQAEAGAPVRVVEERKDVVFKPDAPSVQPPKPRPVKQAEAEKPKPKAAPKPQTTSVSNFYVQFGAYSTRASAEAAQARMQRNHASLFTGKQFVILAAVVDGTTKYRLRVGFNTSEDANGFCRNAKSDGLDCYVTK